jgi:hypothetical protein
MKFKPKKSELPANGPQQPEKTGAYNLTEHSANIRVKYNAVTNRSEAGEN